MKSVRVHSGRHVLRFRLPTFHIHLIIRTIGLS